MSLGIIFVGANSPGPPVPQVLLDNQRRAWWPQDLTRLLEYVHDGHPAKHVAQIVPAEDVPDWLSPQAVYYAHGESTEIREVDFKYAKTDSEQDPRFEVRGITVVPKRVPIRFNMASHEYPGPKSVCGLDVVDEMRRVEAAELRMGAVRRGIQFVRKEAYALGNFDLGTMFPYDSFEYRAEMFGLRVRELVEVVARRSGVRPDYVVAPPELCHLIECQPGFFAGHDHFWPVELVEIGTYCGLKVLKDPLFPRDEILFGRKNSLFYCPCVTVGRDEGGFYTSECWRTVDPKRFAKLAVRGFFEPK